MTARANLVPADSFLAYQRIDAPSPVPYSEISSRTAVRGNI